MSANPVIAGPARLSDGYSLTCVNMRRLRTI